MNPIKIIATAARVSYLHPEKKNCLREAIHYI